MRICFVIPGCGGGGARVIVRYATGLIERGHEVRLLYPRERETLKDRLRKTYLRLRYKQRQNWLKSFRGTVQAYDALTPQVVGRNDLVVGVGVDCVLAIADLPPECGIKVNNCHGREPWIQDRMIQAWRLPMPRIVIADHLITEMQKLEIRDHIQLVHNGIDRTEYYPSVSEDLRDGVGTVYHGAQVKDPKTIMAVFEKIHELRPSMPLRCFGSFPRPRGLPAIVQYTRFPSLACAREIYSRSLVWFCASRSEGFAMPLLEAMACGCAVVSTDCGGPADIINHGVNGFLVPVGAGEHIAARIVQLLDDTALRSAFVATGEARLQEFTWECAITTIEAALQAILDNTRGDIRATEGRLAQVR